MKAVLLSAAPLMGYQTSLRSQTPAARPLSQNRWSQSQAGTHLLLGCLQPQRRALLPCHGHPWRAVEAVRWRSPALQLPRPQFLRLRRPRCQRLALSAQATPPRRQPTLSACFVYSLSPWGLPWARPEHWLMSRS